MRFILSCPGARRSSSDTFSTSWQAGRRVGFVSGVLHLVSLLRLSPVLAIPLLEPALAAWRTKVAPLLRSANGIWPSAPARHPRNDFRNGRRMPLDLLQSLMESSSIAVFGEVCDQGFAGFAGGEKLASSSISSYGFGTAFL